MHGLGDVPDMRLQTSGLTFHAHWLVDASIIRSHNSSVVLHMYGLGHVSDVRFLALGQAFHAHGLVDAYMIRHQSLSAVFIVQG